MTADELLNQPDDIDETSSEAGEESSPVEAEAPATEDAVSAAEEPEDSTAEATTDDVESDAALLPPPAAVELPDEPVPALPASYPPMDHAPAAWPQTGIPALPVAVLIIALGVILLWPALSGGFALVPAAIAAILIAGIAFSLFVYWLRSERRARGAFFIALWGGVIAALTGIFAQSPQTLDVSSGWPLYFVGTGLALFVTSLIDRNRGQHLPFIGFVLVAGGLVALAFTRQIIPESALAFARQAWRWLGVILVLGLVPLAFRRRTTPE
ncbi:MAG: hypothetical protein JXN59_10190 [Anaerolineae bacterium]|nr:hypothetical protein [Anaerolineae bacterium]